METDMTTFEKNLVDAIDGFVDDYGVMDLLQVLFGEDVTAGEVVLDMYNHGMIPTDKLEGFLDEIGEE